jgi:hypothetical protein
MIAPLVSRLLALAASLSAAFAQSRLRLSRHMGRCGLAAMD